MPIRSMIIQNVTSRRARRRSSIRGFTIAEVALAMIILAMMTLMFAAVFPMAVRGAQYSSNYAQAATLAQHKMDQLRSAGFSRLFTPTGDNSLTSLNIIDAVNADGSYDFTTADALINDGVTHGYFPPGSVGTVTIVDYADTPTGAAAGAPHKTLAYVTVTLVWTNTGVANSSYSASTIIAKAAQP